MRHRGLTVIAEVRTNVESAGLEFAIIQLHSFAELSETDLKHSHPATEHIIGTYIVNMWYYSMIEQSF